MRSLLLGLVTLSLLTSCFPRKTPLEPRICYETQPRDVRELKSPFPALLPYDRQSAWGREYHMGAQFAKELDLYRAITSFKRALFELPKKESGRRLELHYNIALCYYLGERYSEAIDAVENTPLANVNSTFPAYKELLVLLYDSYSKTCQPEKAEFVLERIEEQDPTRRENLEIGQALTTANLPVLSSLDPGLIAEYCRCRKSIRTAQVLSAIIPGAGYWYVGQRSSAVTAFILNALFIAAAAQFFYRGYYAAGAFVTSLEAGWYFGGIWGAAEAAHFHNTRLYERLAKPTMQQKRLFPVFQLRYGF